MTRFITLCRGALLFPQTPLAMLHNGGIIPVHMTLRMGPSTKDSPITEFLYLLICSISVLMVNNCYSIPFFPVKERHYTTHSLR
jgi:hypothetical protein